MRPVPEKSPKLLDRMRLTLRRLHYSYRTQQAYVAWVERFIRFHRCRNQGAWKHPRELGKADIEEFLTHLAVARDVSASTQNQAFSAILFLYRNVLEMEMPVIAAGWTREKPRLPVVFSRPDLHLMVRQNDVMGTMSPRTGSIRSLMRSTNTYYIAERMAVSRSGCW